MFPAGMVHVMVPGARTLPAKENDAMANTTNNEKAEAMAAALEQARHTLGLREFDERKSDRLDFYDLHVITLRDAVTAAFEAGFAAGAKSK